VITRDPIARKMLRAMFWWRENHFPNFSPDDESHQDLIATLIKSAIRAAREAERERRCAVEIIFADGSRVRAISIKDGFRWQYDPEITGKIE